jgi:hypothetical protein
MWLSNRVELESKDAFLSGLSSVPVLIVGKNLLCTPPMVWPHATSSIISVVTNPTRAKAYLCACKMLCGSGAPVGPALVASMRSPRKSSLGPPL